MNTMGRNNAGRTLAALLVLASLSAAAAQGSGGSPDDPLPTESYVVAAIEGSGVSGNLQITGTAAGGSRLTLTLVGIRAGTRFVAALYPGNCGPGRETVTLELAAVGSFPEDPFASFTETDIPVEDFAEDDLFVMVFAVEAADAPVACGEVGLGANVSGARTPAPASDARPAGDGVALASQSYGLFAVEGSGVNGVLRVTSRAEGGARLTVTLTGIDAGTVYAAALYEGDCGPDRPQAFALTAVGSTSGDPFAGVTYVPAEAATLFGGDYFLYVREGSETGRLVACGEVGLGANR